MFTWTNYERILVGEQICDFAWFLLNQFWKMTSLYWYRSNFYTITFPISSAG